MSMKVVICTIGIGGWYPRGVARMIQEFNRVSPGYEIHAWVNTYPPDSSWVVENSVEYGPYCAKPHALLDAWANEATIGILLDAAFYPIRDIFPLVDHIAQHGYYLCDNGNKVGDWSSDHALSGFGMKREEARRITEISSYCVGLNFTRPECRKLVQGWADADFLIPGHHTAPGFEGRNVGFVSTDPTVKGHRHDQTTLSILAHRLGMNQLTQRPRFTAYLGSETEETVLVNNGGL